MSDINWRHAVNSVRNLDDFVLLETGLPTCGERHNFIFTAPEKQFAPRTKHEAETAIDDIGNGVRDGLWAAGFFTYELGYCFEDAFEPPAPQSLPLLRLGLYREPLIFDTESGGLLSGDISSLPVPRHPAENGFSISEPVLSETRQRYDSNISRIKRLIERGDTYQINHTFRLNFQACGDPVALYMRLRDRQNAAYSGIVRDGDTWILCLSPELFFRISGGRIEVRPMKGTAKRGANAEEDARLKGFLRSDEKNRAENVMILDLLRNDLGRVGLPCSVRVSRLFDIETYKTLFQMTSTAVADLDPSIGLRDLLSRLFPSGSITGAPKIRSMQIIRELENTPRGVYTGSIGFIAPGMKSSVFNVAIRTVTIRGTDAELGIGGGIVYDSQPQSEWDEALLKAGFLLGCFEENGPRDFALIETIRWTPGEGYFLPDAHLRRLGASAAELGFGFDAEKIMKLLHDTERNFDDPGGRRVRLLMNRDGAVTLESSGLPSAPRLPSLTAIAEKAVLSSNPFLRHKTTVRGFYDRQLTEYRSRGFFDVIFTNERGEITEGAISNVIIEKDGKLYTPPLRCGLLNGVMRGHLVERGEAVEKELYPEDLREAGALYLCNSVQGMVKAELATTDHAASSLTGTSSP